MNTRLLSIIAVGAMLLVSLCAVDVSADDATDTGFDITDDTRTTVHFDGPAEHIVLNGTGAVLTVADAGAVDKIVGVDKYATYEYTGYEQLRDLDAVDLGSFYGETNHDYIEATLLNMVSEGTLGFDDAIILTSYTSNEQLRERLNEDGFTHVLVWMTESVGGYDDIVSFVEDVSMIATGEGSASVQAMQENIDLVSAAVADVPDGERAKALSVWYSSSAGLQINNIGIANSMIELCNAKNIGYDPDGGSRYGDENAIISLLGENPGTVIFLPSSWANAGHTVDQFREEVLNGSTDYTVVQMGALWNNYCPESADGLVEMAQALYPELFGIDAGDGSAEGGDENGGSDLVMWAVALIVAIIIVAAAYAVFKRTHR